MTDVEQLCSRVLIIDHGTLLYDGTLDGIRDRLGTERTLVVDLDEDVVGALCVPLAREVRADGPRRWLQFNRVETTAAELIAEVAARYRLHDLTIEEPDIESIVRRIYEGGLSPLAPVARDG
jgi:ABC-2 type transport system ATP-binding protein